MKKPEDLIGNRIESAGRTYRIDSILAIGGESIVYRLVDLQGGEDMVAKFRKHSDVWLEPHELSNTRRLDEALKDAFDAWSTGKIDEVVQISDKAISETSEATYLYSGLFELHLARAVALMTLGRAAQAEKSTDIALEYDPSDPRALIMKAKVLEIRDHSQEALDNYRYAITSLVTPSKARPWDHDQEEKIFRDATLGAAQLLVQNHAYREAKHIVGDFLEKYPEDKEVLGFRNSELSGLSKWLRQKLACISPPFCEKPLRPSKTCVG